ncbi:MAG: di-heme oxidoredictase family protein [Terriglobales bacterium]|jgi:CxxC motif-containing protein (DUF1111 family)
MSTEVKAIAPESTKRCHRFDTRRALCILALLPFTLFATTPGGTQTGATDPGVRVGPPGAGNAITGLSQNQLAFFGAGQTNFVQIDSVTGSVPNTGNGLGPRFNAESCGQCHAQPAIGGTSPLPNPQIAAGHDQQASNYIPFFITLDGPVREARFPLTADLRHPDGGVHDLFTISGRTDASGCKLAQPDFRAAAEAGNLIFRIPTPVFGGGLIESISDSSLMANMNSHIDRKRELGIFGRPNTSGNDGTITRFGWKAQNKSLEVFAGEAYNVEVGVTNELFPNERDETPGCKFNGTPEDLTNFDLNGTELPSDVVRFATFMRFLDQPQPAPSTESTLRGRHIFHEVGCALCHTASFTTGQSSVTALTNIQANVFSDLLLHHMGPELADNVSQGAAGGDEFRTAPLWGLGQRIFFLHDGRTSDLVKAIYEHASEGNRQYPGSEANAVVHNFRQLRPQEQQDLLNFLRSL